MHLITFENHHENWYKSISNKYILRINHHIIIETHYEYLKNLLIPCIGKIL